MFMKKYVFVFVFLFALVASAHSQQPSSVTTTSAVEKTTWEGFDRSDFVYNGRNAIVVAPQKVAIGRPWIWRPAFFGAFPSVDKALLEKGFHVVWCTMT